MRLILVHFNLKSKYMSGCTFRRQNDTVKLKVFTSWQDDRTDLEQKWTIVSVGTTVSYLILISVPISGMTCYLLSSSLLLRRPQPSLQSCAPLQCTINNWLVLWFVSRCPHKFSCSYRCDFAEVPGSGVCKARINYE